MSDTPPLKFTLDDVPPSSSKPAPKRRGRPPGSTNKPSATSEAATLKQALATMDSLYEFATTGLLLFGLPETALELSGRIDTLKKTNEEALRAAPRLARAIASAGSVGGATTFVVSHVMLASTLVGIATRELNAKRVPDNVTPVDFSGHTGE